MKYINNLSFASLLLLILGSCASNMATNSPELGGQSTLVSPMPIAGVQNKKIFWGGIRLTLPEGMTATEFQKIQTKAAQELYDEKYYKCWKHIIESPSWQVADKYSREYLHLTENHYFAFCVQQEVASSMLRNFFMHLEPTPEVIRAIEFYLAILEKHKYYGEVNLYIQVLPKLKGHWSKQQIKKLADNCVRNSKVGMKSITVDAYFEGLADIQLKKTSTLSASSAPSTDKSILVQNIKQDFIKNLPSKIESYKKMYLAIDPSKPSEMMKWARPQEENIVALSLITEF